MPNVSSSSSNNIVLKTSKEAKQYILDFKVRKINRQKQQVSRGESAVDLVQSQNWPTGYDHAKASNKGSFRSLGLGPGAVNKTRREEGRAAPSTAPYLWANRRRAATGAVSERELRKFQEEQVLVETAVNGLPKSVTTIERDSLLKLLRTPLTIREIQRVQGGKSVAKVLSSRKRVDNSLENAEVENSYLDGTIETPLTGANLTVLDEERHQKLVAAEDPGPTVEGETRLRGWSGSDFESDGDHDVLAVGEEEGARYRERSRSGHGRQKSRAGEETANPASEKPHVRDSAGRNS